MIQANELRRGNWISFDGIENHKIQTITPDAVGIDSDGDHVPYFSLDRIRGVPLTEEILLKAGFVKIEPPRFHEGFLKEKGFYTGYKIEGQAGVLLADGTRDGDKYCYENKGYEFVYSGPEINYGSTWRFEHFFIAKHSFDGNHWEYGFYDYSKAHTLRATSNPTIHQLQNLYFALTGEELEINLTDVQTTK